MEEVLAIVVPIVIIVAIIVAIIMYAIFLNKRIAKDDRYYNHKNDFEDNSDNSPVNTARGYRVTGFIPHKISAFYEVLKIAMPPNYIIVPNVAVELLFKRTNRRDLKLAGQYCDICIFTANFAPVMIIDLNDYTTAVDSTFTIPERTRELLRDCGISVLEYDIRDAYSIDDLRRSIAKTMNPLLS